MILGVTERCQQSRPAFFLASVTATNIGLQPTLPSSALQIVPDTSLVICDRWRACFLVFRSLLHHYLWSRRLSSRPGMMLWPQRYLNLPSSPHCAPAGRHEHSERPPTKKFCAAGFSHTLDLSKLSHQPATSALLDLEEVAGVQVIHAYST